jgi:hypothetical protein
VCQHTLHISTQQITSRKPKYLNLELNPKLNPKLIFPPKSADLHASFDGLRKRCTATATASDVPTHDRSC